jgi:hypothetical protein
MASTHKSLRSGTANKRPTTSIADGQIALNTNAASPGLYFKDSTGASIIKIGPVHVGTTAPNVAPAGSSGNSTGETWLDTSLTPNGWKVWTGAAWTNATPVGSATVQGLLELATDAETQAGSDTARAVTPAGLQSKVSDSTSTTSSTTIASSTAVKSAYDLANAALPKSGGTVTGNLEIGTSGSLTFEGATADAFETAIAVVDPTADRTITFPDTTGTVVTTGDTGTVTSAMIANGTIVDADISASAEIAVSKLADGAARQLLQTDAAGTGVEWTTNVDVPGTLDVTGTTTLDSTLSVPLGSAAAPTVFFTGDSNTGIYSPGADQVAISSSGVSRLHIAADGKIGVGVSSPQSLLHIDGDATAFRISRGSAIGFVYNTGTAATDPFRVQSNGGPVDLLSPAGQPITFSAGGSEKLRITSGGLVGVGTSAPAGYSSNILHVSGATGSELHLTTGGTGAAAGDGLTLFTRDSDGAAGLFQRENASLLLGTNDNTRVTITSAGLVGIGTSAPQLSIGAVGGNVLHLAGAGTTGLRVQNTSGNSVDIYAGTDGFINQSGSGVLNFQLAGTTKATLTSTGLGIGTTGPSYPLDVSGIIRSNESTQQGRVILGNDGNGVVYKDSASLRVWSRDTTPVTFYTNDTERARIDSSGRLLVGTSSARSGSIGGNNQIVFEAGSTYLNTILASNANSSDGNFLSFIKSRGASAGSHTIVQSGDSLGVLSFEGADGSVSRAAAQILAQVDGTPGAGDMPGRLVFSTTADGAASPTERMRITSAGSAQYAAATTGIVSGSVSAAGTTYTTFIGQYNTASGTPGSGTNSFLVYTNGNVQNTNNSYGAISDLKLKENIVDAGSQWDDLKALQVRKYNFKEGQTHTQIGLVAQEVELVSPGLVSESPDRDTEGSDLGTVTKSVNYSVLYMKAVKALQEAMERIEALEAKVTALEGA